jgi:glycosyltransferase 2 family protein
MSRVYPWLRKSLAPVLWLTALALVSWTLSQMPMAEMWSRVRALTWPQWLLWLLLNLLLIVVSSWRWQVLCKVVGQQPGFWRLLSIRQAGQCISFITPGPQFGGEPFQIWWLMQRCRMGLHNALSALGLDRFYELWINFLMLALGIVFLLLTSDLLQSIGGNPLLSVLGLLLMLLVSCGLALWWLAANPMWLRERVDHIARRWLKSPALSTLPEDTRPAADAPTQPVSASSRTGVLFSALLLSLLAWLVIVLEMWLVLGFFVPDPEIVAVILVLVAMRLALLLPLPGGIGTLEASVFWSFQLLDWPAGAALAVIALMRMRDVLVLLAGLAFVADNRAAEKRVAQNRFR